VLILECGKVKEAQALLATLPLVKSGLIAFEIIPLVPLRWIYEAFPGTILNGF
jgi:hypothetical protein